MKKIYFTLTAVAIALSAMAIGPFNLANMKFTRTQPKTTQTTDLQNKKMSVKNMETNHVATGWHAPKQAGTIITEAPQGEVKYYTRSGNAYYRNGSSIYHGEQEGVIEIVFAENNEVYMLNPVSYFSASSYVKGTIEGNTITVPTEQQLYNWTSYGAVLAWWNYDGENSSGYGTKDTETTEVTYTVDDAAGTITLNGSSETHLLAAVYDDDDTWVGYADYNTVYTLTQLPDVVTPPEGLEAQSFYYTGKVDGENLDATVNIVVDGNDYYIQGLGRTAADAGILVDAWVKGTLNGNTLTIPTGQYMGMYNGDFIYLVGADASSNIMDITLTYDADAETFTFDNNYYINAVTDRVYYWSKYTAGNVISKNPPVEPELVTPPAGTEAEDYVFWGAMDNEEKVDFTHPVKIVKDGNDIYFQGLAENGEGYLPEAWVKGTLNGNVVTIPSGQYVGKVDGEYNYIIGVATDGETFSDITMTYDAESDTYQVNNFVVVNVGGTAEINLKFYFYPEAVISREAPAAPEELVVDESTLTLSNYLFKGNEKSFDDDDQPVYTPVEFSVVMGKDAENNVYLKGLCKDLPDAWVRAYYNADNNLVIPTRQYFGAKVTEFWGYVWEDAHYLLGYNEENGFEDIILEVNGNTMVGTNASIVDNAILNSLSYYHMYTDPTFTLIEERRAKPANPEITDFVAYSSYARIECNIPLEDVDGNAMLPSKLYYRIFSDVERDVKQLNFTSDLYTAFPDYGVESMDEIPYSFQDNWDIYSGGSTVYLNFPNFNEYNRVGIQTVYYGEDQGSGAPRMAPGDAPADNESEIVWFFIKDYETVGVNDVNANKAVTGVRYYNLAGMGSNKPFNGMNIVVTTYADGTTSTTKVVK